MERVVRVRGRGRVEVAAYGLADAEHLVEKELARCWPGARVSVLDVARADPAGRIVEEFTVSYLVRGELRVDVATADEVRAAAFRAARELLAGSRYRRTEWEADSG